MKFLVVFVSFLAIVAVNGEVNVVRNDAEVNPDSFKYAYEFDNSIKSEQHGEVNGAGAWQVNGQYSYTSPEGEQVSLQYTADENGYHVDSASPALPTPHPIPEHIIRAIEYINSHPSKE